MNLKFNVKDIDWKQFFLQRGEWLGVGIALAITLPVFFIGAKKAVFSGSADANAREVAGLTQSAQTRIKTSKPTEGTDKPPPESNVLISFAGADPEQFQTDPWFIASSIEDTKRRRPEVLAASDFKPTEVRGAVRIHIIEGKSIAVIRIKKGAEDPRLEKMRKRQLRQLQQQQQLRASMGGGFPGGMMGMAGMMGGGMGGMGGKGGGGGGGGGQAGAPGGEMMMAGGRGGFGGGQLPGAQGQRNLIKSLELMNIDKVKDDSNVKFAEDVLPGRMIVINGSFPFKKQLEAFKVALRMRSLNELVSNLNNRDDLKWRFLSPEVERRVLFLDGRVKTDWEKGYEKTMLKNLTALLSVAVDTEKDDPELSKFYGIKNPGLVWARPQLDPEVSVKYPAEDISSVKESITKLERLTTESNVKVPSTLRNKYSGQGIDPTNSDNPIGAEDANEEKPSDTGKAPDSGTKPANEEEDPAVPEFALVRLLDVPIQPGFIYEYRVRIKMANPNFKQDKLVAYQALAKEKEIVGDWVEVPPIAVPYDINWYVLDDKPDREKAYIQVHRWIDRLDVNRTEFAVADWSILPKTPVFRGEYLGRPVLAKVPTWDTLEDKYDFARDPRTKLRVSLPVDFTVRVKDKQFPAMLNDYEGGKDTQVRFGNKVIKEDTPVETLVLTPEGRLEVRSSVDEANKDRDERVAAWKQRLDEVEKNRRRVSPQGMPFDRNAIPGAPGGKGGQQ